MAADEAKLGVGQEKDGAVGQGDLGITEKLALLVIAGAGRSVLRVVDSEEVLARLRASLRDRLEANGSAAVVHAGDVAIDLANRVVTRAGEQVHLTRKEFEVLGQLARTPGRVVTHGRVLEAAWPYEVDKRIEYLRIVVRNLRQKLEVDPARPALIVNELGIGYRLLADDPPPAV